VEILGAYQDFIQCVSVTFDLENKLLALDLSNQHAKLGEDEGHQ